MRISEFPGFDRLFAVERGRSQREFVADIEFCGADGFAVVRGEVAPVSARAQWAMGGLVPSDLVWTTDLFPMLLSVRLMEALVRGGVTGWSSCPVALTGKKGAALGTFYVLVVRGRCGPLDRNRSTAFAKQFPFATGSYMRGLYFEPSSWDGSDIFMTRDGTTGWIFVTERARHAIAAVTKAATFTPLAEVEYPDVDDLGPP